MKIESALYVFLYFFIFFSRNPPPVRTENRLIVENLSSRVSWQVIIALYFFQTYIHNRLQKYSRTVTVTNILYGI